MCALSWGLTETANFIITETDLSPSLGNRAREGNGTPLQCSCLENPRDGGAWWAAVYGVTQSRTRLKRLSSSSSREQSKSMFTKMPSFWPPPLPPPAHNILNSYHPPGKWEQVPWKHLFLDTHTMFYNSYPTPEINKSYHFILKSPLEMGENGRLSLLHNF